MPAQEKMDIWVRAAEDEYEALDAQRDPWSRCGAGKIGWGEVRGG